MDMFYFHNQGHVETSRKQLGIIQTYTLFEHIWSN